MYIHDVLLFDIKQKQTLTLRDLQNTGGIP